MARFGFSIAFAICCCAHAATVLAEPEPMVAQALAVQRAMLTARDHLTRGEAKLAVDVLESEILHINGNANYLALLREAYAGYLKELQLRGNDAAKLEYVRKQLRILDPKGDVEKTSVAASPAASPPAIDPTPMRTESPTPIQIVPATEPLAPIKPEADPFQQEPLDRSRPSGAKTSDLKAPAMAAFDRKQYGEADKLFAQAVQARTELSAEERAAWGYCKLHELAVRLNKPGESVMSPEIMEQEARIASELGGERLSAFAKQVMGEIQKRKQNAPAAGPTTVPEGWQVVETGNFRVIHRQNKELAAETARVAEAARTAMFDRWSGPAGANWSPRCDIWLHATGADYAKATQKSANDPGHATVNVQGNRVTARRIDLRADDAETVDVTVPHEVTYLVVSDLFIDQPLPRWAEVAMTVLSEPPAHVGRYLHAVPKCAQEKKLLPVGQLLSMNDFAQNNATAFYVQSVSLGDYLVRLKGAKAFAIFLREAPRRGFDKALQTHYGFKDANDLQEKWLKHACGGN